MQRSIPGRASVLDQAREAWQAAGGKIREAPVAFPMLVGWCCASLALAVPALLRYRRPVDQGLWEMLLQLPGLLYGWLIVAFVFLIPGWLLAFVLYRASWAVRAAWRARGRLGR